MKDHNFTGVEQAEYDSLRWEGRSFYDELRWDEHYSHEDAFIAAAYHYGLKPGAVLP